MSTSGVRESPETTAFDLLHPPQRLKRRASAEPDDESPRHRRWRLRHQRKRQRRSSEEPVAEVARAPEYRELNNYTSKYPRFHTTNHITTFALNNARIAKADAEANIRQCFAHFIDRACANAQEAGKEPDLVQVIITAEGMDSPIVIPPRGREQNTVEAIFNEYHRQGVSALGSEHKLYNTVATCIVTTLQTPKGGARTQRFDARRFFGVEEKQRLRTLNTDSFCLFYAIELARLYSDRFQIKELKARGAAVPPSLVNDYRFKRYIEDSAEGQREYAMQLMRDAGVDTTLAHYGIEHMEAVQRYYDERYPGMYRIVAFDSNPSLKPVFKGGDRRRRFELGIYLENGHFDALKNIHLFFKVKNYCVDCECTYYKVSKHRRECVAKCRYCHQQGPNYPCVPEPGVRIECDQCHREFYSQRCFDSHKAAACNLYRKCLDCGQVYRKEKRPHQCGDGFCRVCGCIHDLTRDCWIQPIEVPEELPLYRMVFFDMEASQDTEIEQGVFEHRVNFVSARVTCSVCNGSTPDCGICGPCRHVTWSALDEGVDPLHDFVEWVLTAFKNRTETLVFGHYAGRYDNHFVFQELCRMRFRPRVTMNGLKIYEMKVKAGRGYPQVTFRDSWLLLNVKLAALKDTFDLRAIDNKHYFPHLYNCSANYETQRDTLPDADDYCPDGMMPEERRRFEEWYAANRHTPFSLRHALAEYCSNDTAILQAAMLRMRELLLEITDGYDVLYESSTIASVCMRIFRAKFLKREHLSIVPERGYERNERQSRIAINYFNWLMHQQPGLYIQHSANGGEKAVPRPSGKPYKLDGYVQAENRAIEFLGCEFHVSHLLRRTHGDDMRQQEDCAEQLQ